jgi:hypothetical protein
MHLIEFKGMMICSIPLVQEFVNAVDRILNNAALTVRIWAELNMG